MLNASDEPEPKQCNGEKAELENYLMVVLSFGGRHADAAVNLQTMVPKRLLKNRKLHEELARGFAKSGGTSIPFDHVRLCRFFAMTARALAWHHWQVLLGVGYSAIASTFSDSATAFFEHLLNKTPIRVMGNLGNNTFSYEGAQTTDYPEMNVWRFSMYGGVLFAGGLKVPGPISLAVAVTGRDAFIKNLQTKTAA